MAEAASRVGALKKCSTIVPASMPKAKPILGYPHVEQRSNDADPDGDAGYRVVFVQLRAQPVAGHLPLSAEACASLRLDSALSYLSSRVGEAIAVSTWTLIPSESLTFPPKGPSAQLVGCIAAIAAGGRDQMRSDWNSLHRIWATAEIDSDGVHSIEHADHKLDAFYEDQGRSQSVFICHAGDASNLSSRHPDLPVRRVRDLQTNRGHDFLRGAVVILEQGEFPLLLKAMFPAMDSRLRGRPRRSGGVSAFVGEHPALAIIALVLALAFFFWVLAGPLSTTLSRADRRVHLVFAGESQFFDMPRQVQLSAPTLSEAFPCVGHTPFFGVARESESSLEVIGLLVPDFARHPASEHWPYGGVCYHTGARAFATFVPMPPDADPEAFVDGEYVVFSADWPPASRIDGWRAPYIGTLRENGAIVDIDLRGRPIPARFEVFAGLELVENGVTGPVMTVVAWPHDVWGHMALALRVNCARTSRSTPDILLVPLGLAGSPVDLVNRVIVQGLRSGDCLENLRGEAEALRVYREMMCSLVSASRYAGCEDCASSACGDGQQPVE